MHWITVSCNHFRLQSTNRFLFLQLKNELHRLQMKDKSMVQYVGSQTKGRCYQCCRLYHDAEDIIFEELNIASDSTRELPPPFAADSPFALTAVRGRACGHGSPASGRSSFLSRCSSSPRPPLLVAVVAPVPQFNAYIASETATNVDWLLDTGASSHPTSSTTGFQSTQPYSGPAQVQGCNGQMTPIAHSGSGILPTPASKFFPQQLVSTSIKLGTLQSCLLKLA